MTPERIAELIPQALTDYYGHKCKDFNDNCICCQAWAELSRLTRERDEAFNAGIEAAAVKSDHYAIKAQYRAASHDNPVARNAAWDKNEAGREIAIEIRALKKPATGQATGEK